MELRDSRDGTRPGNEISTAGLMPILKRLNNTRTVAFMTSSFDVLFYQESEF